MGKFIKGDVVVIPFPFSDLSQTKRRPALVLATLTGDDVILCQITSQTAADHYAVALLEQDMTDGKLGKDSNIRPNRLFTADQELILYRACRITPDKLKETVRKVVEIFTA